MDEQHEIWTNIYELPSGDGYCEGNLLDMGAVSNGNNCPSGSNSNIGFMYLVKFFNPSPGHFTFDIRNDFDENRGMVYLDGKFMANGLDPRWSSYATYYFEK